MWKLMKTQIEPKYDQHLRVLLNDIPGLEVSDYEILFYNIQEEVYRTDTHIAIYYDDENPAWTYALMQMDSLEEGFERMINRMREPYVYSD